MLPAETGNLLLTIILSSSVLYEMVGPVSAKTALFLSGSISREKDKKTGPEGAKAPLPCGEEQEKSESITDGNDEAGEAKPLKGCEKVCTREDEAGEIMEEACEEGADEEELHAVLPELVEYSRGASESDTFNMEREVEPQEISSHGKEVRASGGKKKKKGKGRNSRK